MEDTLLHQVPAFSRLLSHVLFPVLHLARSLALRGSLALALLAPLTRAADVGTLTGSVNNRATGSLVFSCDVSHLLNEPPSHYRGIPDQLQRHILQGTTVTFGFSRRF